MSMASKTGFVSKAWPACCLAIAMQTVAAADEAVVGATQASFNVNQQGSATYRVPIAVAPGPGGFQPTLALTYNSHTGDGPLGAGWTIEGLSTIHRCAAIKPVHGYRGRVELGADDRLCIDGRFLTPVDEVATPLQSREFRTRIESFTKVLAHDDLGDEIAAGGFTAWTKEGQIIRYGGVANARIARDGKVFSWLINRVADRAGNEMLIHYVASGNERHVERIDYANGSVLFEYEAYAGASVAYLAGMAFPLTRRLVRVSSRSGGQQVREYRLAYEEPDALRPARLKSITECAAGGACLRPTVFTWQPSLVSGLSRWGSVAHPGDSAGEYRRYYTGDFNGDGLADVYEIHASRGGADDAIQINRGEGVFESVPGPWTEIRKDDDLTNFHFADFNGDGLTDIYQFRYWEARDTLYLTRLAHGALSFEEVAGIDSGVAASPSVARGCVHRDCLRFADFNGDARTDVYRIRHQGATALADELWLSNGDGSYTRSTGIHSGADSREEAAAAQVGRIKIGDFNGDGFADVYRVSDSAITGADKLDDVYLTLHAGKYRRIDGVKSGLDLRSSGSAKLSRVKLGDFNGDGLTDVYYVTAGAATPDKVYLSHGDGRYTVIEAPGFAEGGSGSSLQASLQRIRLGDFNGDGRTDIYHLPERGSYDDIYLTARGGGRLHDGVVIRLERPFRDQSGALARVHFGDFNGDGASDVYHVEDARKAVGRIYAGQREFGQIEVIRDGLGAGMRIIYAPLTAVHEIAAHSEYDAVRIPPPIQVVSETEILDGDAQVLRVEGYRYGGARSAPSGFGFLGFAWQEMHDRGRQLVTRMVYSQSFPHFGSVLEQTVLTSEGGTLSISRTEYATLELNDGKTLFPYSIRAESQRYELNGSFVSSSVDLFSYDEYGNVVVVESANKDESRGFGRRVNHDYWNDPERWILGRRVRSQTVYSDDLHANFTQLAEFEYDRRTGFLLAETAQPDEALAVTRRYEYDGFGNRVLERMEPVADAAPAMTTRWVYDQTGRFALRVVNAEGHTITRRYDERFGRVVSQTDANGLELRREYDGWGRLRAEIHPDGTQTQVVRGYELPEDAPRGSAYLVVEQTTTRPLRRVFYDVFNQVLSVQTVGFDGRVLLEDREYDRYGRVARISLPHYRGEAVDWVDRRYDRLDRLVEEDSPLIDGAVTTRRFNYLGSVVEQVDELGHSRWVSRDALGQVVAVSEPLGAQKSFEYDPAGRMIKTTDAHGNETVMEYDAFGHRTRVTYPDQGLQRFEYDPFGRVIITVDAAGETRRMKYDRLGRLLKRRGPEGTASWSYDASENGIGKLASESYGGHHRSFRYNNTGQVTAIDDHRGYVTAMTYDRGRLQKIHYPRGFIVENVYDERGYLSAVRSPYFDVGDFSAVAAGDLATADFYQGKAEEYNRLASFYRRWAAQSGGSAKFTAALTAAAGELEGGARRLSGEVSDAYDATAYCARMALVKLARAEELLRDVGESYARLRLSGGVHLEQQMYALMALSERRLDDAQACLAAMPSQNTRLMPQPIVHWQADARDTVGRVVSERSGDGWHTRRRYHTGNGYLQEIRSTAGERGDVRHLIYDYDEADNLLSRSDQTQQISEYFGYDELGRLTAAVVLSDIEHDDYNKINWYRYDALGNLVFHSDAGDYLYGSDAPHAATQIGEGTYEYDASGNLVSGPGLAAEWFSFGKPAVLETDDARIEFAYDANGKRLSKQSSNGDVTLYLGKFYEKTLKADGGVEHRYYIYAGNALVAMRYDREDDRRVSRRLRYLHRDALGSVDTVSNEAGEIVTRLSYTPFGKRRASNWRGSAVATLPLLVNRGFTGHEHLDEVGLVHMNGRIYDPRVGRFLSPDPYVPSALLTQSYNRYSYALNNPMKFSDPSGFFFKKVFKGIKRAIKKVARFVRRNARVIAAVAAGYYAGVWASNAIVQSATSKLVWSPGGMWSGTYISAYNSAVTSGAIVGGVVSGGVSSALSGGNLRGVLANAAGGGVLGGLGIGGQWGPQQVLTSAAVNGATAAAAGGSFRDAALSSLKWGGLRYASAQMRRAMIAQSLINPDNAGGLSGGLFGDRFKLGGGRYNVHSNVPSPLGGHQGGEGTIFGFSYKPDSLWDRVVEAYAGSHDYLNSFYWYDELGNINSHLSPAQRRIGEVLNGVNVLVATPFAAASLLPAQIPIPQK